MKPGRKPTGKVNVGVTLSLHPDLLKEIDKQRGEILRSRFITSVLAEFLHCQTSSNIQHSSK